MNASVLICGGGTGGHIHPGLAIAAELITLDIPVSWLGTTGGMEEELVPRAGISLRTVSFAAPSGGVLGYLGCIARLAPATQKARKVLRELNARVVLGLGGYPSLPGVLAAVGGVTRRLIHEQNVIPGLANRLLAPLTHVVLTSHAETFNRQRPLLTGNPIRKDFAEQPHPQERFRERAGPLRLLVLGGSRGAASLNEAVPAAVATTAKSWQVEHAAGASAVTATRAAYAKAGITAEVAAFFTDMAQRMATADLIVCRAGAATIEELACIGAAAIIVPYPHARQHQKANATSLVQAGAAITIPDAKLVTTNKLSTALTNLADRSILLTMASKSYQRRRADAARQVAQVCAKELRNAS